MMKSYTILLYAILLLSLSIPSFAGRANFTSGMDKWPAGEDLATFKTKMASNTTGIMPQNDRGNTWGDKWYDNKLFLIETESITYGSVKISRIITLSSSNVVLVFDYNGYTTYLPFKKVIRMQEVK